jgi:hypothetical protein
MHDLPDDLDPGLRDSAEATMTSNARQFDPKALRRIGRRLVLHLNPDEPDPEKNHARRGLAFQDDLPGLIRISGRCTADAAATIQSALDPLAKPRPEVDGIKDLRTYPQRMIDALEDLAGQALRGAALPSQGGEKPHVYIGLTPREARAGVVHLPWVGPVPLNIADWMLCDSAVTFIEVDENGVPIRISTPQRTLPGWLRRSVFERDKGCSFPGCDKPTGWSDIHHVLPWEKNKEHQIDNLVTPCSQHHKIVHQQKWQIDFINRIPHYRAPKWIDPAETPRRNHIHHSTRDQPLRN